MMNTRKKLKVVFFFFGEGAMHAAVGETEERCFVCNEREKKQVVLHVGGCC